MLFWTTALAGAAIIGLLRIEPARLSRPFRLGLVRLARTIVGPPVGRARLLGAVIVLTFGLTGTAFAVFASHGRRVQRVPRAVIDPAAVARGLRSSEAVARERPALPTRARRSQRLRSRSAYRHLTAGAAIALAVKSFHIDHTGQQPLSVSPGVHLDRPLGRYSAVVSAPNGKHLLVRSMTPLIVPSAASHPASRPALLSLALKKRGNSFAPLHPFLPFTVASQLAQGVTLPGGIALRPVDHAQARPPVLVGNRLFFANSATDTDFAVQPTPTGLETFWYLRSANSPQDNALDFTLPAGMTMRPSTQVAGGIEIDQGGSVAYLIAPPAIHDADGIAVPGSFRLSGNRLILHIPHRNADVHYPIEVDPYLAGFRAWYGYQNGYAGNPNSGFPSSGAWQTGAYPSNPGYFSFLSPANGYPDRLAVTSTTASAGYAGYWWIGSGPWSPSGSNSLGTPFTGYINRVDLIGIYSAPGYPYTYFVAEFYPHNPYGQAVYTNDGYRGAQGNMTNSGGGDFYGNGYALANVMMTFCPASGGGSDSNNSNPPLCDPNHVGDNNLFEFGLGTLSSYTNGWAYSMIKGAQVIFDDVAPPQNVTVANAPSAWVQAGPTNFTVSAQQPGLGLGGFSVTNSGSQIASQNANCPNGPVQTSTGMAGIPNYRSAAICPESATSQNYDLSGLPEGTNTVQGHAQSLLGYDTASPPVTIKVDNENPQAPVLSGPLYDARTEGNPNPPQLNGITYPMHIRAVDPGPGSGIRNVNVSVDSGQPTVIPGQCTPDGNCTRTFDTNYVFNNLDYPKGTHRVDVWTTDQVPGHVSPTVTFHVNTQPPISLGPNGDLLQNDQLGLEKYYQYRTVETGAGSRLRVNVATGNAVWDVVPMVNPGQGLSTFVEVTYNSQHRIGDIAPSGTDATTGNLLPSQEYNQLGQGFSLGISGPTRLNEPLDLTGANLPWPQAKIAFTDTDGTRHIYMADPGDSSHQHYLEPPGVFLYLRKYSASDQTRTWAMSRPDGVTYFFDQGGYETSIQDRHHNTITFKLKPLSPVCVGLACVEQVTDVIDQNGRAVHVGYNSTGQVADITDHAGRDLHFDYVVSPPPPGVLVGFANLRTMTQAYGTPDARAFTFCYGGGTSSPVPPGSACGGQDSQPPAAQLQPIAGPELTDALIPPGLTQITDPNQNNTRISYCAPGNSCANSNPCPSTFSSSTISSTGALVGLEPKCVIAVADRGGGNTTFAYNQDSNKNPTADVNGPRTVSGSRPDHWLETMDAYGRPTDEVAPTSEQGANRRETQTTWNGLSGSGNSGPANTLAQLVEAAGVSSDQVTTTFTYDLNGRLVDRCGPAKLGESQCWRDVHIDYQHSPGTLLADNNVDSGGQFVSDPTGLTTARGQKYTFQLDPTTPADGLVTQVTDPAGKVSNTRYDTPSGSYADGHGLVTDQIDPLGQDTKYGYSSGGSPEPNGLPTTKTQPGATYSYHYRYDAVGNLLNSTDPRAHDPSSTSQTTPFTTTFAYDNLDRVTDQWVPKISTNGIYIQKHFTYDANGNLKSSQNQSAPTGTDTRFTYDYTPMDWLKAEHTPAVAHADGSTSSETTSSTYDEAGNLIDKQLPLGQGGGQGHETTWTYDGDNEPLVMNKTNPAGTDQLTSYFYDARGNVIGTADPSTNAAGCPSNCGVSAAEANANPAGSAFRERYVYDAANNKIESDTNRQAVNLDGTPSTVYDIARAQFDQDNNLIASEDARGPSASISGGEFDLSGTSYTARYAFEGRDLLTDRSDPSATGPTGPTTHYDRRDDGKICAITKPNGVAAGSQQDCTSPGQYKTRYTYYPQGWLQTVTLPIAPNEYSYNGPMQITYGRDDYGLPTTITDARGQSFQNTFYDGGQLQTTNRPEWWTYDLQGSGTPGPDPNLSGPGQVSPDTPGAGLPIRERTPQELAQASQDRLAQRPWPTSDQQGKYGSVDRQPLPPLLPHAGNTSFAYDYEMRLAGITDQPGNQTTLASDAMGRTTLIDQPFDSQTATFRRSQTRYAYDEDGNLAQSIDPMAAITNYSYDLLDRPTATTAPGACAAASSTSSCSPTPEVTTYAYVMNPTDKNSRVADANGSRNIVATNEVKTTRGSSSGSGEVTTDDYDALGRVISESHPQMQSSADPVGLQTTYAYDGVGNQLNVTRPQGNGASDTFGGYTTARSYDGASHPTSVTVMDGNTARTTTYTYDGDGNLTQVTAPGAQGSSSASSTPSQITSYTYNGRDLPWTISTGTKTARTTVTEYDPNGNLIRSVNASGVDPSTKLPYYAYGGDYSAGQTTATDPSSKANIDATIRVYYASDTLRTVYLPWGCAIPANDSSSRQCDPSQIQDTRRWREDFSPTTDGLQRLASISEAYNWTANSSTPFQNSYQYFANGWIKQSTAPNSGVTSTYDYDANGDQTSWTTTGGPNATTRTVVRGYWADGKVCARAKAANANTLLDCTSSPSSTSGIDHYYYTPTEQRSEVTGQCTDGQSTLDAKLSYDLADRLTAVYGAGPNATAGCGTNGPQKDTTYAYNLDGKVVTRKSDGTYDPTTGAFVGGETASFGYDTLDRETSMNVSASGQPTRDYSTSYWPSGQVNTRTRSQEGQDPNNTITEQSFYNDDGTLAEKKRSSDSQDLSYGYDANGNRSQSENGSHLYNALNQEIKWTRGDNQGHAIENQANPGSTVSYTLNGDGALISKADTAPIATNQSSLGGTTTTTNNLRGDLILSSTTQVQTNDNPTTINCSTTANYAYGDLKELKSITPQAGTGTGCPTTTTPPSTYDYDTFDHITKATGPDPKSTQQPPGTDTTTYIYDPLDRRASKTEDGGNGAQTTYYGYIGLTNQLSQEKGPDPPLPTGSTRTYDYSSGGERLGLVRVDSAHPSGLFTSFAKDASGSVEALEDPTKSPGTQVDDHNRYHYTPYGDLEKGQIQGANNPSTSNQTPEQALGADAQTNSIRFESFYYDSGVKTYDELSRSYRPDSSQFTTEDHFEQALGDQELAADPLTQSRYAYAGGNPTSNVEYDGHGGCSPFSTIESCNGVSGNPWPSGAGPSPPARSGAASGGTGGGSGSSGSASGGSTSSSSSSPPAAQAPAAPPIVQRILGFLPPDFESLHSLELQYAFHKNHLFASIYAQSLVATYCSPVNAPSRCSDKQFTQNTHAVTNALINGPYGQNPDDVHQLLKHDLPKAPSLVEQVADTVLNAGLDAYTRAVFGPLTPELLGLVGKAMGNNYLHGGFDLHPGFGVRLGADFGKGGLTYEAAIGPGEAFGPDVKIGHGSVPSTQIGSYGEWCVGVCTNYTKQYHPLIGFPLTPASAGWWSQETTDHTFGPVVGAESGVYGYLHVP